VPCVVYLSGPATEAGSPPRDQPHAIVTRTQNWAATAAAPSRHAAISSAVSVVDHSGPATEAGSPLHESPRSAARDRSQSPAPRGDSSRAVWCNRHRRGHPRAQDWAATAAAPSSTKRSVQHATQPPGRRIVRERPNRACVHSPRSPPYSTVKNEETNDDGKRLQPSVMFCLCPNLHEYGRSRWLLLTNTRSGRNISRNTRESEKKQSRRLFIITLTTVPVRRA
jgi:hypothetical protein